VIVSLKTLKESVFKVDLYIAQNNITVNIQILMTYILLKLPFSKKVAKQLLQKL
jgi:hypothetical protein